MNILQYLFGFLPEDRPVKIDDKATGVGKVRRRNNHIARNKNSLAKHKRKLAKKARMVNYKQAKLVKLKKQRRLAGRAV